eukprot:scaffold2661_cov65-Cylindrotheca_fusiformis.AAC.1
MASLVASFSPTRGCLSDLPRMWALYLPFLFLVHDVAPSFKMLLNDAGCYGWGWWPTKKNDGQQMAVS